MAPDNPVVLIVEDEQNLADLFAAWLADEYAVRTAYDGEQALDQLDEGADVVLLDRRMPGLSGDEVLSRIRDQGYECRVAMVTAVEPDFDIIELGFDDYVRKPVSQTELHSVVEKLLTRATYDETLQEYYALVAKRAALAAEKPDSSLMDDSRYQELLGQIEEYEATLERAQEDFDSADYKVAFRDLDEESGA